MSKYTERAKELFMSGYNCSQSVFCAFAEELGISEEKAARISIGLGGGVGRMREVCGAITGAAMVVGLAMPNADKAEVYETVRKIADEFRKVNPSIVCKELLGLSQIVKDEKPEARTEEYYKKRPCVQIVCDAAAATEKILYNKENN